MQPQAQSCAGSSVSAGHASSVSLESIPGHLKGHGKLYMMCLKTGICQEESGNTLLLHPLPITVG